MQEDAILECEYRVIYDDVNKKLEMTNVALLKYLEEPGIVQTYNIFGDIHTPKGVWVLLGWQIKKIKNLKWNEKFSIKTWPALHTGVYSIRNFEVYNEKKELVTIVATKWVLMDIKTKRLVKDIADIISRYNEYNKMLFDEEIIKLKEPVDIEYSYKYIVSRRDIDTNNHLNNVRYLEIAYEVLPLEVYENDNFTNIDIMYKHSAFLGDELNVGIIEKNKNEYTVVIKSNDKLNAIIRLN